MKGSIRFFLGLLIVFGAVGTMEVDESASVVTQLIISVFGAIIMISGMAVLRNEK